MKRSIFFGAVLACILSLSLFAFTPATDSNPPDAEATFVFTDEDQNQTSLSQNEDYCVYKITNIIYTLAIDYPDWMVVGAVICTNCPGQCAKGPITVRLWVDGQFLGLVELEAEDDNCKECPKRGHVGRIERV